MAFRKVSGTRKYFKYSECKSGQLLVSEGTFVGSEEGKFGIQHVFQEKDGDTVVLNSAGHLNWLLENYVDHGKVCRIHYGEKKLLTKGVMAGKEAHTFELEVDDAPVTAASIEKVVEAKAAASGSVDDISL